MNNWTQFNKIKGLVHHSDGRPPLSIEIDKSGNAHLYLVRTSTSEQNAEDQAFVLQSRLKKKYSILILRGQSASKSTLPKELHSLLKILNMNVVLHVTAGDRATRHPEHIRQFQELGVVKVIIYKTVDNIEEYDLTNKADSARLMCIASNALLEVLTKGQLSKEGKIRASRKRLRNGDLVKVRNDLTPFGQRVFYLNKHLNDAKHYGLTDQHINIFLALGYTGVRITNDKIQQFSHHFPSIIKELMRYKNCETCHIHKDDFVWFLNKILGPVRSNMSKNMVDKIAHWLIYTFSTPTKIISIKNVKDALLYYKDKKYYTPLPADAPAQLVPQVNNTLGNIIQSMQSGFDCGGGGGTRGGGGGGGESLRKRLRMLEKEVCRLRKQLI